jgi:CHASE2 domain-containing sensor protein
MKKFIHFILINIIIVSIFLFFLPLRDIYYKIESPIFNSKIFQNEKKVVLIDIDNKTLDLVGQWPLKRLKFLEIIKSIEKYNINVLGINILFNNSSEGDDIFIDEIKKLNQIVFGYINRLDLFPFENLFKNDIDSGYLDLDIKNNHSILFPKIIKNNHEYKSFSLTIFKKYSKAIDNFHNTIEINYYGPKNSFKHYSAIDFLQNKVEENLNEKIAILGAIFMPNEINTPVGLMSNSEIQANCIQNLLDKSSLKFNYILFYIINILFSIIVLFLLKLKKNRIILLIFFSVIIILFQSYIISKGFFMSSVLFVIIFIECILFNMKYFSKTI